MSTLHLDLQALYKAIDQLKTSLAYYHSELAQNDANLARQFIAASIQAFEYTYELSIKFLRRYLKMTEPSAKVIAEMTFSDLIRLASTKGLLLNPWPTWKEYRDKRNITSHTYDEKKADLVMTIIPDFLREAEYLSKQLREHIKQ